MDTAELARLVAEENGFEYACIPEFGLGELDVMRTVVAPSGTEYRQVARDALQTVHRIQVGCMKRCTEDELDDLIALVQARARSFLGRAYGPARCVGVEFKPLYLPEHFRERRQFTSVFEAAFQEVGRR